MLPNKFVILWNNEPIGIENGYPFKTSTPFNIHWFNSRIEAQTYINKFINSPSYGFYGQGLIKEIQFKIMDET